MERDNKGAGLTCEHIGMEMHFESAGWILGTEARIREAEKKRASAEEGREKAEEIRQEAEKIRETAEGKRDEAAQETIKKVDEALASIADTRRTYLLDLSGAYQDIALQIVSDITEGHPVLVYIRAAAGGPLTIMLRVRDVGQAYLFTSGSLEGQTEGGIAEIAQVQYAVSKQTGNIQEIRSKVLSSLLTTGAVQDSMADLDETAGALPVSQRQAAALRRLIEKLDGEVLKKDDVLILNGNGVTDKTK